jgi:hypothetical protein
VRGEHRDLVLARGQADVELEQEAVELRLGQRVGALVLDRVLRRADDERVGQRPGRPVDGHLPLLHRLEQEACVFGGVRLISSASRRLVKTGPGPEDELAVGVHQRAGDVAGHEVGGELHALGVERQRGGAGPHEQRLGHAGTPSSST